ncbi:hypothetical protein [Clostridium estertheticum]|uniref:hypothetical protein n=1 Tax=Clostridium estertheticum TaxID=238834 RepID=UPI001C7D3D78|nr:hypothetical protein [Clostridium estertheticum]MBX4266541.1 hypothetical protein [Clostridium estertheticum]WLC88119.1 hypothetical protein KTC95_19190 [Clostridium estertheticum]
MINVERVVNGRNSQPFIVYRKSGSWVAGRWVQTEEPIPLTGTITVAKEKDLQQVPEGDRVGGEIAVYCTKALYTTRAADDPITSTKPGTSDEVLWQGERYRLFTLSPYMDYGYYKGVGIRMASN